MRRDNNLINQIDWLVILLYCIFLFLGWLNIYAADFDPDTAQGIFNPKTSSGKQLVWIGSSGLIILLVMLMDFRFYDSFAFIIYGVFLLLLIGILGFGQEVAGNQSWFVLGPMKFQPSELAKFATALALAKFLGNVNRKTNVMQTQAIGFAIFLIPAGLILLQGDLGTAMVFGSFVIVMFREGLHPVFLIVGIAFVALFLLTLLVHQTVLLIGLGTITLLLIGLVSRAWQKVVVVLAAGLIAVAFVLSVDFILNDVLKPHQQKRVLSLINPNADPLGIGWNVTQSKIAIGSGGLTGKGYLEGTQTKFDFVPAQTTDFIFCTIGEEQGWMGSTLLILLFAAFFIRLVFLAERQKSLFARVYGYCVVSVLFFHFAVNIAMTIGLFPVIGIPLPFFSYGGSSLWGFTVLLFTFIKLDAHRMQVLERM